MNARQVTCPTSPLFVHVALLPGSLFYFLFFSCLGAE